MRLKRFLELRGADAVSGPLAVSVPALWKGLLYDSDSLAATADLAECVRPADLPGLFESAYRHGLAAHYQGRSLAAWCRDLLHLAADGLRRQAEQSGQPTNAVIWKRRSRCWNAAARPVRNTWLMDLIRCVIVPPSCSGLPSRRAVHRMRVGATWRFAFVRSVSSETTLPISTEGIETWQ